MVLATNCRAPRNGSRYCQSIMSCLEFQCACSWDLRNLYAECDSKKSIWTCAFRSSLTTNMKKKPNFSLYQLSTSPLFRSADPHPPHDHLIPVLPKLYASLPNFIIALLRSHRYLNTNKQTTDGSSAFGIP